MPKSILLLMLVLTSLISHGQNGYIASLRSEYDRYYGLDVLLHNGVKFRMDYKLHNGHPFWGIDNPFNAELVIKGKSYKDRSLKYNIEKQEFILIYKDYFGAEQQIVLNNSAIDTVKAEDILFIKNKFDEIKQNFIQEIYKGDISCYSARFKYLRFKGEKAPKSGYEYSTENKFYFLVIDNIVNEFGNKRTFLKAFPKKTKPEIKRYLATGRIRFRNISDRDIKNLVSYCEGLLR